MATDFSITDITSAVASATATVLSGPQRKALAAATYAAHKGGAGILPAFTASWPGAPAPTLTPQVEKAFDTAVQAAKAQRLAKRRTAGSGGATTPDPAAEKKAALEKAVQDTITARKAAKTAADNADDDADAAKKDAEAAEADAEAAQKALPGSAPATRARTAATAARQAATKARTAANTAKRQFQGAEGDEVTARGIRDSNGSQADAAAAAASGAAAKDLAERQAEIAKDEAKVAKRHHDDAEAARKEAEAKRVSWLSQWYNQIRLLLGAALVAWVAFPQPYKNIALIGSVIVLTIIVVSWAREKEKEHRSGKKAASLFAGLVGIGMVVLLVVMPAMDMSPRGFDTNNDPTPTEQTVNVNIIVSNPEPAATPTPTPKP